MRKLFVAAALVSAAAVSGCSTMDDGAMPGEAADMTPEERTAYVAMAASGDLYEIQSGQLAEQRSQRSELRQFGATLVAHHTQTTQQLTAAAQASGMSPPPPALLPMHQQMLSQLQQASGAGFDNLFVTQQMRAHEMALNLHRNYANNGDAPPLRAAAAGAVPIVTQHLAQARQLD
jgi:putative membrane protein